MDSHPLTARVLELERRHRFYAALRHINQVMVRKRTRADLFRTVCEVFVEEGGFGMAWVGWHDPATARLMPVCQAGDKQGYLESIEVYVDERPEGRGPSGTSFREDRPYICNDIREDPASLPWRPELARSGFRASAVVPIHTKGRVVGTLNVYAERPLFFGDQEVALLVEAAADISYLLDNLADDEARRTAEAVAESEQRFASGLIDALPGILYFYDEQGRFLRWNRNFERVSGYSAEEIANMHPLDFFADEDKPLLRRRIAEVFERGESSVEASFVSKDGSATAYYFTGKQIVLQGASRLVGVGVDISERIRAERALRELNENLERRVAERTLELDAARERAEAADQIKSAFLATMSDELRSPLDSILEHTGIVLQGEAGPLSAEQETQLGMAQGSALHLLELINDVLDLSKIQAGQLEVQCAAFDLRAAVERVAASVTPLAERKGLTLRVAVPALGPMLSDRRRVEQILLNLLHNAIKFTDHGGVTLTVAIVDKLSTGASQPVVRFRVADTGIGIKQDDLSQLFQPFQQIDAGPERKYEGTGLGLAICRRLTSLLGGTIHAQSAWGQGSVLVVDLPMSPTPARAYG